MQNYLPNPETRVLLTMYGRQVLASGLGHVRTGSPLKYFKYIVFGEGAHEYIAQPPGYRIKNPELRLGAGSTPYQVMIKPIVSASPGGGQQNIRTNYTLWLYELTNNNVEVISDPNFQQPPAIKIMIQMSQNDPVPVRVLRNIPNDPDWNDPPGTPLDLFFISEVGVLDQDQNIVAYGVFYQYIVKKVGAQGVPLNFTLFFNI